MENEEKKFLDEYVKGACERSDETIDAVVVPFVRQILEDAISNQGLDQIKASQLLVSLFAEFARTNGDATVEHAELLGHILEADELYKDKLEQVANSLNQVPSQSFKDVEEYIKEQSPEFINKCCYVASSMFRVDKKENEAKYDLVKRFHDYEVAKQKEISDNAKEELKPITDAIFDSELYKGFVTGISATGSNYLFVSTKKNDYVMHIGLTKEKDKFYLFDLGATYFNIKDKFNITDKELNAINKLIKFKKNGFKIEVDETKVIEVLKEFESFVDTLTTQYKK